MVVKPDLKHLRPLLEQVFDDDQQYRRKLKGVEEQFGPDSNELAATYAFIEQTDRCNLRIVEQVLKQHNWPDPACIGDKASVAVFLVILHADLATQQQYLPLLQQATAQGKLLPRRLAMLEDRIAVSQGKKQCYGTQIGFDALSDAYYLAPVQDPAGLDKRRAAMGLGAIADYLKKWHIDGP